MSIRLPSWFWAGLSTVGVGFLLVLCSCHERAQESAAMPPEVVAQIGDRSITADRWQAAVERLGPAATPEQKQQVLQDLIRIEVLLAHARKAGFHQRADLVSRYDQFVGTTFKEEKLQPLLEAASAATESEIAAYCESHSSNYTSPEAVRLGVISLKLSTKASPEQRTQARERADALLAEARQADEAGFGRLAQQHSEDQATRYRSGDAGWISDATPAGHWPREVIEAGRALAAPGDCAPAVETGNSLYIVRLLERRPAARRPLAEVRDGIRYLVVREKQQQVERRFYEQLSAEVPVKLNRALLDSLSAPSNSMSSTPPPLPGG